MSFKERFDAWEVPQGKVGIVWVGQAGFLFKTSGGKKIALDPYVTDYTHRAIGTDVYIRMAAPVFEPGDIDFDYYFISHEHPDHTDVDGYDKNVGTATKVFGNPETLELLKDEKKDPKDYSVIKVGDVLELDGFKVTITQADHGPMVKHALGFMFDFGCATVYYGGDTAYTKEILQPALDMEPQIALLPINGAYGNLNAVEAAVLARDLKAKVCIPHHFWMFPDHVANNGEPMSALKYFPMIAPDCQLFLNTPGSLNEFGF